jgi:hypothetical protein
MVTLYIANTKLHHKTDKAVIQSTDSHEVTTADVLVLWMLDRTKRTNYVASVIA